VLRGHFRNASVHRIDVRLLLSVDPGTPRLEGFAAMTSQRVSRIHRGLIAALVSIYIAFAIVGIFWDFVDGKVLWVVILGGAAAAIVIGAVVRNAPWWISVGLISVGAIVGGVVLLWTILVPLAAAVLVALTFSISRRSQPA